MPIASTKWPTYRFQLILLIQKMDSSRRVILLVHPAELLQHRLSESGNWNCLLARFEIILNWRNHTTDKPRSPLKNIPARKHYQRFRRSLRLDVSESFFLWNKEFRKTKSGDHMQMTTGKNGNIQELYKVSDETMEALLEALVAFVADHQQPFNLVNNIPLGSRYKLLNSLFSSIESGSHALFL